MSISSPASPFIVFSSDVILPLVPGRAEPVCTAAASSPAPCRKPASKFHEVPSGWAGWCDVPKRAKSVHYSYIFILFIYLNTSNKQSPNGLNYPSGREFIERFIICFISIFLINV